MPPTSPVKVSTETDRLLSEASHFLARSKKDIVDAAVRDYVEAHRDEINEGVRASLQRLDGSRAALLSELTGFDADRLRELGGAAN